MEKRTKRLIICAVTVLLVSVMTSGIAKAAPAQIKLGGLYWGKHTRRSLPSTMATQGNIAKRN